MLREAGTLQRWRIQAVLAKGLPQKDNRINQARSELASHVQESIHVQASDVHGSPWMTPPSQNRPSDVYFVCTLRMIEHFQSKRSNFRRGGSALKQSSHPQQQDVDNEEIKPQPGCPPVGLSAPPRYTHTSTCMHSMHTYCIVCIHTAYIHTYK